MSVYDLYKPLRNNLRKVSLIPSLRVIWAWIHHLQFDTDFPTDIKVPWEIASVAAGPKKGIFEWELATLAKELVLNAPERGATDMRVWKVFAESANHLKNLDDAISQHYAASDA